MKATIARSNLVHPLARALATAALLSLGACASFDGQPRPILEDAQNLTNVPSDLRKAAALKTFYEESDATKRKNLRDRVIGVYLAAADERYSEFRRGLSREVKGANFGFGTTVLGLTTGASLAGKGTANALSALASAAAGTQGTLSKEVYFEKTLPALLAGIDATRTSTLRRILTRMSEDAASYSLTEAFVDVERYAAAASLESAIEMVTAQASERRALEQARFDRELLFISGVPEEGVTELRYKARTQLSAKLSDAAAIKRAASALNVAEGSDTRATVIAINRKFAAETNAAAMRKMVEDLTAALEGP